MITFMIIAVIINIIKLSYKYWIQLGLNEQHRALLVPLGIPVEDEAPLSFHPHGHLQRLSRCLVFAYILVNSGFLLFEFLLLSLKF